jgi:hypothetical protein
MRFMSYWTLAGLMFLAGFLAVKSAKIGAKIWLLSVFG